MNQPRDSGGEEGEAELLNENLCHPLRLLRDYWSFVFNISWFLNRVQGRPGQLLRVLTYCPLSLLVSINWLYIQNRCWEFSCETLLVWQSGLSSIIKSCLPPRSWKLPTGCSRKTQCCVNCIYMKTRPSVQSIQLSWPWLKTPDNSTTVRNVQIHRDTDFSKTFSWRMSGQGLRGDFYNFIISFGVSTLWHCDTTIWYSWPSKCLFLLSHCGPSTTTTSLHQGNIKLKQSSAWYQTLRWRWRAKPPLICWSSFTKI